MNKIVLLLATLTFAINGMCQQYDNSFSMPAATPIPVKRPAPIADIPKGPANNHTAQKATTGSLHYSDWYDLWDEMLDTNSTHPYHSYLYLWDVAPDSNIYDVSGIYPPYHIFTHGIGVSFDPSDSAYFYSPVDTAYRVSAPFDFTKPYALDSFWMPGEYLRNDTTSGLVDSLIVEFLVSQVGSVPDSGAYALIASPASSIYLPFTYDSTPRFVTPRYIRAKDECIDPVLTTTLHQRFAFPLTLSDAFTYRIQKFGLTTPVIVSPGKYLAAYVYFKSQVVYPLGTLHSAANYYWMYAGEPRGTSTWFPQSGHNNSIGYPGSHQAGLIATNQIRYNNSGFTFGGHNVLIPECAYANTGANLPPGFSVPYMSFHILWTDPVLAIEHVNTQLSADALPNPAGDRVEINYRCDGSAPVYVSLMNPAGRVVITQNAGKMANGTVILQTSTLPGGLYLYTVTSGSAKANGRILIIH